MSESKEQPKPAADDKDAKKEQEKKEIHKDADVLKLLEADEDDFEEFEEDAYGERPQDHLKSKQWREDWEDEDINDDFANQLKRELNA